MKKAIVDIDGVLNYYPDTWLKFLKDNYYYTFIKLSIDVYYKMVL